MNRYNPCAHMRKIDGEINYYISIQGQFLSFWHFIPII